MKRNTWIVIGAILGTMAAGCCGTAPRPPAPAPEPEPVTEPVAMPDAGEPFEPSGPRIEPPVWTTPDEVKTDCEAGLARAETLRQAVVGVTGNRNRENTLEPLNDLMIEIYTLLSISELIANVHPETPVRSAAEGCQQDATAFVTRLELDREVYDALTALVVSGDDALTRRFLEHLLRDYRLAGVDKDEETRSRLAALKAEMVKVGQAFARAIREDTRSVEVGEAAVSGLPDAFLKAHATGEGTFRFTTEYPDFMPVVSYADKESLRKSLYKAFLRRGYPDNEKNLEQLLRLRYEYATLLGFADWAEYNAQDKMASSKEIISDFIENISDIARPRMRQDLKMMLKRKQRDVKTATKVRVWDRFYYANKIRDEQFGVDGKTLRNYFEYTKVLDGTLALNASLFGVGFEKVPDAAVWHEDVVAYNVIEGEEVIGRFYLDMHPREGKYSHAAQFSMLSGIAGRQIPSGALVCNFPKPSAETPALLEHDQVTTVFHEFGHLMNHIFAGRQHWATFSGNACERDFVEVASQILEKWAWRYEVLKTFTRHVETGETIPEHLVEKMNEADEFGRGVHVMRQMSFAALSYTYHASDPETLDLMKTLKQIMKKYNPYPYEKGTYFYANFGHLESYSSLYYTYMWSLVLAEDMFTRFENEGIMNPATAHDFREKVLAPGGSVDGADMVRAFLGREKRFDAMAAYLKGESSAPSTPE